MKDHMQLIFITIVFLTQIFLLVNANSSSYVEQLTFETRVKHADTILFGRFNWAIPISNNDNLDDVYASKQKTFEFSVYCTIKKIQLPDNVPRFIRIVIEYPEIEMDMRRNSWFILFPKIHDVQNTWIIDNRSAAFDLEDDLELRIFEQFCFLKPKLPIGFPTIGLLNRCPQTSPQHCLKNGTKVHPDELLELKTFLRNTTTRKTKRLKSRRSPSLKATNKRKRFIEPVW